MKHVTTLVDVERRPRGRTFRELAWTTFGLVMLLVSPNAYAASVTKCVDSSGKVTFTDGLCSSRDDSRSTIDVRENSLNASEGRRVNENLTERPVQSAPVERGAPSVNYLEEDRQKMNSYGCITAKKNLATSRSSVIRPGIKSSSTSEDEEKVMRECYTEAGRLRFRQESLSKTRRILLDCDAFGCRDIHFRRYRGNPAGISFTSEDGVACRKLGGMMVCP